MSSLMSSSSGSPLGEVRNRNTIRENERGQNEYPGSADVVRRISERLSLSAVSQPHLLPGVYPARAQAVVGPRVRAPNLDRHPNLRLEIPTTYDEPLTLEPVMLSSDPYGLPLGQTDTIDIEQSHRQRKVGQWLQSKDAFESPITLPIRRSPISASPPTVQRPNTHNTLRRRASFPPMATPKWSQGTNEIHQRGDRLCRWWRASEPNSKPRTRRHTLTRAVRPLPELMLKINMGGSKKSSQTELRRPRVVLHRVIPPSPINESMQYMPFGDACEALRRLWRSDDRYWELKEQEERNRDQLKRAKKEWKRLRAEAKQRAREATKKPSFCSDPTEWVLRRLEYLFCWEVLERRHS